jgi:hypothetical protein
MSVRQADYVSHAVLFDAEQTVEWGLAANLVRRERR